MSDSVIRVSAVVLRDDAGRVLTVRKRGTTRFMLPGGKPEPGESSAAAAIRECREELGAELRPWQLTLLGTFETPAANEDGYRVLATVFSHPTVSVTAPTAEVEELRWTLPTHTPYASDLAPLLADAVFPALDGAPPGLRRVTVFTGSSPGRHPRYAAKTVELAVALAEAGIGIVYGGAHVGLMGVLADAALAVGGRVHGVIPQSLLDRELAHTGLTSLDVVDSMHDRKLRMAELGDAFVALPGGAGTLDELFEVWTWQQLGIHRKPVALYDEAYWRPLLDAIDHTIREGFGSAASRDAMVVASRPDDLIGQFSRWRPPHLSPRASNRH